MLNDLKDREEVDGLELGLISKQFRPTKRGSYFMSVILTDKSGSMPGVMWDASRELFDSLIEGNAVTVCGEIKPYNGNKQIEIFDIRPLAADKATLDLMEEMPSEINFPDLIAVMNDAIKHRLLPVDKVIIETLFSDNEVYGLFTEAPAAMHNHHVYRHGLLVHSVNVMEVCFNALARSRTKPVVDMSLLTLCSLLHDIGKIYELNWGIATTYTTTGQLGNHSLIGANIVRDACRECGVSKERTELIVHCIHAHHGKHEFEASVLPKTPEANILHLADMLESKMEIIRMAQENTGYNAGWSGTIFALGVPLYFCNAHE